MGNMECSYNSRKRNNTKSTSNQLFFQKIDLPVTASGSLVLDFQSTAARKLQQVAFNVPSRKLANTADFSVENIPLELDTGSAVATSTLYMMFVFVPIVLLF